MMESLWSATVTAWVLGWLAAIGICVPAAALGPAANRPTLAYELGPALVWTWLTMAIGVPLAAAVHGFNWVTALLISAAWPTLLWLIRYRGAYRCTFRDTVRALVFRAVAPHHARPLGFKPRESLMVMLALPLLAFPPLVLGRADIRLPMPADFDTLWRTRYLLAGTSAWDPLASLAAVLTRLSSADALQVAAAMRLALVALTAIVAGIFVVQISGRRWAAVVAAAGLVVLTPRAAAATWAVTLVALIGLTSVVWWIRDHSPRDGWHALAALLLVTGQLAPFSDHPEVLWRVSARPQYLEYRVAAREAIRLERSQPDNDWVLVGPPEQQLEIAREGGFYDLARFVSRFQDRAGDPSFRFDLRARRLFVLIEKQPFDAGDSLRGVRFVAAQPAAYRVPRERLLLEHLARQICDDYRRTHAGVTIIYDDAILRVYGINL